MNWYLQSGKKSDVVFDSKIELSRNIVEFPFETKCTKSDKELILKKFSDSVKKIGYGLNVLKLKDMDEITKESLVEKKLISKELSKRNDDYLAIAINEEENICIVINDVNHFKIQVFSAGLQIEESLNLITEIDQKMEKIFNYAYSEKYGFLTSSPGLVGTGMKVYVYMHLLSIVTTRNLRKIIKLINDFGMNISSLDLNDKDSKSDIFVISNKQTLGLSESEIVNNVKIIVQQVIEQERLARKFSEKQGVYLEDNIYRNYGILSNCRRIGFEEAMDLLSEAKLGTDLGIIKELDDLKIRKLYLYIQPGNLQKFLGKKLSENEMEIARAEVIKKIMEGSDSYDV